MANEHLNYVFGADISGFQNAIKSVEASLKSTGQKLKDIGGDLSTYVSLPLAALGGAAIKAFGDIQSLKNGLTAVTGSAKETEKQFGRLVELAKLPGLGLKEVTKGSINLQVIGFSAEKAEKAIKAFGNAVATVGGGRDEFQRATYGLAQLANTDFPLGEDLNIIKDAIPQVTPLLKEAFGTARSDDLKTLGVTSAQVVDTIVSGLSKLPPVTGGVNAAFENLKDGVFTNLAEIGEIINKNLDIAALSDKIVDGISSITQWFKSLSPEIQKATLIFGGLAIVIPPILVGLGVLIGTVIPALMAGFAAVLSPIGLVVAAIAGAAYVIIDNWDAVKAYFTNGEGSKFWESIKSYATDLWESLKSIFNSIKSFAITIWKNFGDNIISIVGTAFKLLQDIITTVLGVISNVFKVFSSVLKGDWSGAWEGLKGITSALWNGITNIIKAYVKQVANVLSTFFKAIGADSIANSLSGFSNGLDKFFNKIQTPIKAATKSVKDFKKELVGVDDSTTSTKKTETKTTAKTDNKIKEKIADVYKDLEIGLKQIDQLFGASFDEKSKKRIDEYQQAINGLIKNGVDPLSASIKKLQALQQANQQLAAPKLTKIDNKEVKTIDLKIKIPRAEMSQELKDSLVEAQQFNDQYKSIIGNGLATGIGGAFSAIGEAFASGGNVIESFGTSILKSFGSFLGSFGDLLINYGTAAVLKGKLDAAILIPGAGIIAGGAAIAAGIALKIAAGAFSSIGAKGGTQNNDGRTAFAKGGIVSSPTNAVFGEYPSAGRGNPEVVTPLNSLKGMLSDMGGIGNLSGEFIVRGDTLVAVLNNYDKRQNRTN